MKIKSLFKFFAFALVLFFAGCSMEINEGDFSSSIKSVTPFLNRSIAVNDFYMGGSVVYSSSGSSQLVPGVVVSVRLGKIETADVGEGVVVSRQSDAEDVYGYIKVLSVDKSAISFEYYKYSDDEKIEQASYAGLYTLKAEDSCDLNGDGLSDMSYRKPYKGRAGYKTDMWLNFRSNDETTAFFAVLPQQYLNSTYPSGLIGVNSNGARVVSLYNVGTNSRSVIENVSNGDFFVDSINQRVMNYTGSGITARSARAVTDDELEEVDSTKNASIDYFEFSPREFGFEFSVFDLLAQLPQTVMTRSVENLSIIEAVDYLNTLMLDPSFVNKLCEANPGETADNILQELSEKPVGDDIDKTISGRIALTEFFPDYAPALNISGNSVAIAFPNFYASVGEGVNFLNSERNGTPEARAAYTAGVRINEGFTALTPTKNLDKYSDDFLEYARKRDHVLKEFSKMPSISLLEIGTTFAVDSLTKDLEGEKKKERKQLVGFAKDLLKSLNTSAEIGAAGSWSAKDGNPNLRMKVCFMTKLELNDKLSFKYASGSVFEKTAHQFTKDEKKMIKELEAFLKTESSMYDKDKYSNTSLIWKNSSDSGLTVGMQKPSEFAKQFHSQFHPIAAIPLLSIVLSGKFDVLYNLKFTIEFNGLYCGGYGVFGAEINAGLDWGFRKKIFGVPLPHTFYVNPYANANWINEIDGFAGLKYKSAGDMRIGGSATFTFTPVAEFRIGVGIGTDIGLAKGDITAGIPFNFALPITLTGGIFTKLDEGSTMVPGLFFNNIFIQRKMQMRLSFGIDVRLYMETLGKRWEKAIPIYEQKPLDITIFDDGFTIDLANGKFEPIGADFDFEKSLKKSWEKYTNSLTDDIYLPSEEEIDFNIDF